MNFTNKNKALLTSLSLVVSLGGVNVLGAIAQSSNGVSWRRLAAVGSPKILTLIPSSFLSGFENGEVAITALSSYRTAYIVVKNGTNLNTTSTVGIQANGMRNLNFNHPESSNEAYGLPAMADFPQEKYDASQLIEIVKYAPKYDGESTRSQARQSRSSTLSNGTVAYYLQQDLGRQGWCVFTDESVRYSDFTCVNIANSPKAALTILDSLSIVNLPSLSNVIPSNSSISVKKTDTIAKYPAPDEIEAFDNKFLDNSESLVKLRGNQAEQRRKFQNEWIDRNPNAAKFLGAWYTGDRYFYVFPATAKGGTCVVTQDANGKLNMQVGTVLNKELRYGGGKGFFWRDRENIVASRDSGSGSLYPIYATSAIPELPESIIGDMERQKCITALPFEADAQYYKERGDKFAKLGKKDEAISNYRKALELLRKQNLFAQIRTIESLIANLGGTPPTKPITQKPSDTVYSGVSPLDFIGNKEERRHKHISP